MAQIEPLRWQREASEWGRRSSYLGGWSLHFFTEEESWSSSWLGVNKKKPHTCAEETHTFVERKTRSLHLSKWCTCLGRWNPCFDRLSFCYNRKSPCLGERKQPWVEEAPTWAKSPALANKAPNWNGSHPLLGHRRFGGRNSFLG